MIKLFRFKTNYIHDLEEYLISLGYTINHVPYSEIIPNILYQESNFRVIRFENQSIEKQIELYITSNNSIASFTLFDLNHSTPEQQYCNPQLMTILARLDEEEFNHFETYGFHNFGKKEFVRIKKVINRNISYLVSSKKFPKGNIVKYPGLTDLCSVKENLNEVMTKYGYKLSMDGSKYNPKFTKPNLWFEKNDWKIKFVRRKSRDENFIFAVEEGKKSHERFFSYGAYESGRAFNDDQWKEIKSRLHLKLSEKL